jgi:signal transduction histidine kinase
VAFSIDPTRLDVVITADGRGLGGSPGLADRPHYGLRAMRERAASIGATVDWANPADGGFRIHLTVPTTAGASPVALTTGAT